MRLHRLEIEGYRGFWGRIFIDFPEGNAPMVLVGVNGSGKTAVLEAIVDCLRLTKSRIIPNQKNILSPRFKKSDINKRSLTTNCKIEWNLFGGKIVSTVSYRFARPNQNVASSQAGRILNKKIQDDKGENIPIVIYYPTLSLTLLFILTQAAA